MLGAAIGVLAIQWGLLAWDVLGHHRTRALESKERVRYALHLGLLLVLTVICIFFEYQPPLMPVFGGLAVLALLVPTLDEWAEGRALPSVERWTHAMLYVFQPLAVLMIAVLWPFIHGVGFFAGIVLPFSTDGLKPVLIGYAAALGLLLALHFVLRASSEAVAEATAGRIERSS